MKRTTSEISSGKFGMWTVVGEFVRVGRRTMWPCRCDCGTERLVISGDAKNGKSNNCGCVRRIKVGDSNRKHGLTKSREYIVWAGMKARCNNQKNSHYKRYGGRGIRVCERWDDFTLFISDMGPAPSTKHQLDRIDNDGNYEPGNVRWVLNVVNSRNRPSAHVLTFLGETRPLNEWAERIGLKPKTLYVRIYRLKWPVEKAMTTKTMIPSEASVHGKSR